MKVLVDKHDRRVELHNDFVRKFLPNTNNLNIKQLHINAKRINETHGFDFIYNIALVDNLMQYDMPILQQYKFDNDVHLLDAFIDFNIKLFPYCNTDLSEHNCMQYNNNIVIIDLCDAMQGHVHDAKYVVGEMFKECLKLNKDWNTEQHIKSRISGTVLELEEDQWKQIKHKILEYQNKHKTLKGLTMAEDK